MKGSMRIKTDHELFHNLSVPHDIFFPSYFAENFQRMTDTLLQISKVGLKRSLKKRKAVFHNQVG